MYVWVHICVNGLMLRNLIDTIGLDGHGGEYLVESFVLGTFLLAQEPQGCDLRVCASTQEHD